MKIMTLYILYLSIYVYVIVYCRRCSQKYVMIINKIKIHAFNIRTCFYIHHQKQGCLSISSQAVWKKNRKSEIEIVYSKKIISGQKDILSYRADVQWSLKEMEEKILYAK